MEKTTDFRSSLGKVRGLGAAQHGVSHWWLQRVTALAILPLSLWLNYHLIASLIMKPDMSVLVRWLSSPISALFLALLLGAIFVHAKLGLQVIIEDYIHAPVTKYTLLIAMTFVCYGAAALGILSVLKLHLLGVFPS